MCSTSERRMTSTSAIPPLAPISAVAPAAAALLGPFRDVRQQRHLTGTLDRRCHLHLVPAAGTGDAAAADLALLGDVAAQLVDVLVVDLRDVLLAEEAVAASDRPRRAAGPLALLLLLSPLSGHASPRTGCRRLLQPGSRRSPAAPRPARTGCRRRRARRRRGRRGTGRCRRRSRPPRVSR